jgi:hypothetical protein
VIRWVPAEGLGLVDLGGEGFFARAHEDEIDLVAVGAALESSSPCMGPLGRPIAAAGVMRIVRRQPLLAFVDSGYLRGPTLEFGFRMGT